MSDDVLLRARPVMWRARPFTFLLCAALIVVYGAGFLFLGYWWLSNYFTELTVTDRHARKEMGIITNQSSMLRHQDIKNIQVDQGPIQYIMGTGTLELSSAGQAAEEIIIRDIKDPESIRQYH